MFILDTDASDFAIGAELSQVQDGEVRTIAYASNILLPTQRSYCVTRKELLAVVKFTDQFRHFLLGRTFTVRTDHNSLVWLFSFRKLEGQLARWQEQLPQFHPQIVHRRGSKHSNADGLSRLPDDLPPCDCYKAGRELKNLPCGGCNFCTRAHNQWERFCEDVDDVLPLAVRMVSLVGEVPSTPQPEVSGDLESHEDSYQLDSPPIYPNPSISLVEEAKEICSNWLPSYSQEELRQLQIADPDLNLVIRWLEDETILMSDALFLSSPTAKVLWLQRLQLRILDGVLYYIWLMKIDKRVCLVVPASLRKTVLNSCHNDKTAGHLGEDKTIIKVKRSFWWPHVTFDCILHVKACEVCGRNKSPSRLPRTALKKFHSGYPMERVHIDVLGPFTMSALGNKYVLVMIDQFTK